MTDRKSKPRPQKPVIDRIRERAKDLIRDIVEGLDALISPAPVPVPVPVRVRPRRR